MRNLLAVFFLAFVATFVWAVGEATPPVACAKEKCDGKCDPACAKMQVAAPACDMSTCEGKHDPAKCAKKYTCEKCAKEKLICKDCADCQKAAAACAKKGYDGKCADKAKTDAAGKGCDKSNCAGKCPAPVAAPAPEATPAPVAPATPEAIPAPAAPAPIGK